MAGCGYAARRARIEPSSADDACLTVASALAVLGSGGRVQLAARAAGRRRTRGAADPGRARQPAGRRRGRGRAASRSAAALTQVAAERSAHAQALSDEITRLADPTSTSRRRPPVRPPPRRAAAIPRRRWPTWSPRCRRPRTAPVSWRAPRRAIGPACSARSPRRAPRPTRSRWPSEQPRHDLRRAVAGRTDAVDPATRAVRLRSPSSTPPSTATAWCRRTARPTSTTWCPPR